MLTVGVTRCASTVGTAVVTGSPYVALATKCPTLQLYLVSVETWEVVRKGVEEDLTKTVGVTVHVNSQVTAVVT